MDASTSTDPSSAPDGEGADGVPAGGVRADGVRRGFDVLAMGRIGVDLYPQQSGVPLDQVETFAKYLGGSATNVAVAAARHGRRCAVVSRTGADPFGTFARRALRGFGVDDRWVTPVPHLPTPVTFCELFPPDSFPLYFYRYPKAPDLEIRAEELDLEAVRAARILWVTGTGLCAEPSRSATLAALAARSGAAPASAPARGEAAADGGRDAAHTVVDLDWRPAFWGGEGGASCDGGASGAQARARARPVYRAALAHATVAVGNLDEAEVATGCRDPLRCAEELLALGPRLVVVKLGPDGVLALRRHDGGSGSGGRVERVTLPPLPVRVVNGLGAGDAFGGALCHGLLAGWELERVLRFANAAGALVAGRHSCSSAMPTPREVEALLDAECGAKAAPAPAPAPAPAAAATPAGRSPR